MADIKTYAVSKAKLIEVTPPVDTRTYKAMSHERLIDLTLEGIQQSGFKLERQDYSMARKGNVANGHYTISDIADSEMQIQIGWQNSYDKSITLKWAMGVHIFICSNGCISGDMGAFKKKHQGQVQTYTPQAIAEYVKTAQEVFVNMQGQREQMKQIELTKRTTAELLGRMVIEDEFITTTQLNIIERELKNPSHDYGAPNSLWELYQFVTYSMKEIHPTLWMDSHIDANQFFVTQAGIIVSSSTVTDITTISDFDKRQLNLFDSLIEEYSDGPFENLVEVYNSDDHDYADGTDDSEIESERGDAY
jgi:hypothetical protein